MTKRSHSRTEVGRFRLALVESPEDRPIERSEGDSSRGWTINGYPAEIRIWTAPEWASLEVKPGDACPTGKGLWVALRMA